MKSKALLVIVLILATVAFVPQGWTANAPDKKAAATQVTDASGRSHARPADRISDAQRKAAAQQRKARVRAAENARAARPKSGR